ncbi:hypothetical protein BGZ63DRAFT_388507 [Mariannaea sp. PMI_226]|nr:hypothetical protein BGZ63DRAFT_388507 [Mariannaea sp. PMI_226]
MHLIKLYLSHGDNLLRLTSRVFPSNAPEIDYSPSQAGIMTGRPQPSFRPRNRQDSTPCPPSF